VGAALVKISDSVVEAEMKFSDYILAAAIFQIRDIVIKYQET
jgi:hypothetical protein